MKRRNFIRNTSMTGVGLAVGHSLLSCDDTYKKSESEVVLTDDNDSKGSLPLVIATWNVPNATAKAWDVLQKGGTALDAVEQGCMVEEADETGQSVGKGGLPDRDGHVTLDACIMDKNGNCGSVVFLENIVHAVSVARNVMEKTPHVMLAGKGAEQFAYEKGFPKENLLTDASKKAWEEWKKTSEYKPPSILKITILLVCWLLIKMVIFLAHVPQVVWLTKWLDVLATHQLLVLDCL